MVRHARVWYRASAIQLVLSGSAAVQCFNSKHSTARKILQADMQLSSQCNDCWSSHIWSAMICPTQSYMFKGRLLKCEPIDLNRFVAGLRERHLDCWVSYSDMHPRERNSKHSTYHQWCALPTKRALVTCSACILLRYMFLDLPQDVIHSVARFRLCAHTLRAETVTWTHHTSLTFDLCNAYDVRDERGNPPRGAMDMDTVTSGLVLLCKMRCMFFFTVKTVCSQKTNYVGSVALPTRM